MIDRRLNFLSYVLHCYRVEVEIVSTHSSLPYFLSIPNLVIYLNTTRRGETDTRIVIAVLKQSDSWAFSTSKAMDSRRHDALILLAWNEKFLTGPDTT